MYICNMHAVRHLLANVAALVMTPPMLALLMLFFSKIMLVNASVIKIVDSGTAFPYLKASIPHMI